MERKTIKTDEPAQELPLHLKYRPRELKDVIGQDATVKSLADMLKSKNPNHTFLLTGPSGCGKTTLARIIARKLGCDDRNIMEVDAASNSGIDAVREIQGKLQYLGFGESSKRAIIVDECHGLSKQAWQAFLKTVEEPPAHAFFFFNTTETGKVPETIATRALSYSLKPVKFDPLMDLLEDVAEAERFETPASILELVARACNGSPRMALVMLAKVHSCESDDEAADLLESAVENAEIIDLCRLLISRKGQWSDVQKLIKALPDTPAESIRIAIINYLSACVVKARSENDAADILDMMRPFSKPFATSDKLGPLLIALGDALGL